MHTAAMAVVVDLPTLPADHLEAESGKALWALGYMMEHHTADCHCPLGWELEV